MTKKILIFLIILFICTGCNIEYNIKIDKNLNIDETVKINGVTNDELNKIKEFNLNIPINKNVDDYGPFIEKIDEIKYYNLIKKNSQLTFKNKFTDDIENSYENSTLANLAYEYISAVKTDDNMFIVSAGTEFSLFDKYQDVDEVKITIHANYKDLMNNADEVKDHDYTWLVTRDNATDKNIYLKLDISKEELTLKEKIIRGDYLNIFTVSIFIALIAAVVYMIIKIYSNKKNKI